MSASLACRISLSNPTLSCGSEDCGVLIAAGVLLDATCVGDSFVRTGTLTDWLGAVVTDGAAFVSTGCFFPCHSTSAINTATMATSQIIEPRIFIDRKSVV